MVIADRLLDIHPHTRPGRDEQPLDLVRGVVFHWAEWAGRGLADLREYLNELPRTEPHRFGSYHYGVGLSGEIERWVPEDECAWHAGPSSRTKDRAHSLLGGQPNWRTIGIVLCHPDTKGAFLRPTWDAAAALAADIGLRHDIPMSRYLRHYDCTGKYCPSWFARNPSEWDAFLADIRAMRDEA